MFILYAFGGIVGGYLFVWCDFGVYERFVFLFGRMKFMYLVFVGLVAG